MSEQIEVDPRVELAAERTMLAWVRTGLSMMGFGFVVARFGLFLRELGATQHESAGTTHGLSLWAGVALVALGVVTLLAASFRHVALLKRLRAGIPAPVSIGTPTLIATTLAAIGAFMAIYLLATAR